MMVYAVRVISKNFVSDFGANLKNIIGGRLISYEKMLKHSIDECNREIQTNYPNIKNTKLQITEFSNASIAVAVYGEWNNK